MKPPLSCHRGWSRRRFLQTLPAGALLAYGGVSIARAATASPVIVSVRGPLMPSKLDFTLPHEHVLVDFIGADKVSRQRYDADDAFQKILPFLEDFRERGGRTLVECTPAYLGRDPLLLQRLGKASGVQFVTNTGYYGAANNKYLPPHAFKESASQLAERWLAEFRDGIEGTEVRPGFIKIGVEGEKLSEMHQKLVEAAALTHRGSGLTIASHTGSARLAEAQLAVLKSHGVAPSAFIFAHAQSEPDAGACVRLARQGAWISYDGFQRSETRRYFDFAWLMRKEGLLNQLLFSHDAGWFRPGEENSGEFRPYTEILNVLLPDMLTGGFQPSEVREIFAKNPARALAVRQRTL